MKTTRVVETLECPKGCYRNCDVCGRTQHAREFDNLDYQTFRVGADGDADNSTTLLIVEICTLA